MTVVPAVRDEEVPTVRVTAHLVPEADPPYDDGEPPPRLRPGAPLAPYYQPGPSPLRLVEPPHDGGSADDSFDPVRTPRRELEDPLPRAAMLARALLEAASGVRPVAQLARWVAPDVLAVLQAIVANRSPQPLALRRVLVAEPLPGVAEVTVVVQRGARTEALALRMDGLDGRWLVTALQQP